MDGRERERGVPWLRVESRGRESRGAAGSDENDTRERYEREVDTDGEQHIVLGGMWGLWPLMQLGDI